MTDLPPRTPEFAAAASAARPAREPLDARLARVWRRIEGPTWLVILGVYGGWAAAVAGLAGQPAWLMCPVLAVLVTWHGHLQHELIHGHPTRRQWLNDLIGYLPLGAIYPYPVYKRSHLAHHETAVLTHPELDPESYYVMPETWASMGPLRRGLLIANNTLLGRLVLGPALAAAALYRDALRRLAAGDRQAWRDWSIHFGLAALLLWGLWAVAGIEPWLYVLGVAYPGQGLLMVRSFLEHRPADRADERTAVVEGGPFWSLLFLNNNLHVLHHERPGVPWYELRALYDESREAVRHRNGGYVFRRYGDLALRYLVRPKDLPVFPI